MPVSVYVTLQEEKIKAFTISDELYYRLLKIAHKTGCSFTDDIIRKAWKRYGVSEDAILKYINSLK